MNPQSMTPEQRDAARYKGGVAALVCRPKGVDCVAYVNAFQRADGSEKISIVAYAGKAIRPTEHLGFGSRETAAAWIGSWSRSLKERAERKQSERAARGAFKHTLQVGQVLETSWGWEQTNVDFYEVTALVGEKSVVIRKIRSMRSYTGDMTGTCVPSAGAFTSEPMTKRVTIGNRVRIDSCATATVWDGTPSSWSSYA